MTSENTISRRGLFMKLGILFNGLVATALTVPMVRFLLSSVTQGRASAYLSWVPLGRISEFPEGETRLATFRNPHVMPTDGKTVDTACWVRRVEGEQFQVFAINCAHLGCPVRWFPQSGLFMCHTACWVRRVEGEQFQVFAINCAHLGCPVRWFPQSGLFMCPCHGGAYYRDGSRASGPPERGLFEYPYKVQDGMVTIQAGELPTPGSPTASLFGNKAPCGARNELVSIESKLSASSETNALLRKTKTWA